MKYLLLAAVAAGALFLTVGAQTPVGAVPPSCSSGFTSKTISNTAYCVPNACSSMSFDHAYIGTTNADVIRITGSGRWFVDGKGGNDFIAMQGFNGPNCIMGGAGIDTIVGSPFMRDVCVTNDGTSQTADSTSGSEGTAKDTTLFCKTVSPAVVISGF